MVALKRRRQVDSCLGAIQLAAAVAVIVFGASLKADVARFRSVPAVAASLEWMQGSAWLVVVAGPIAVAVIQGLRRKFGNPWAWEAIQRLLDEFRNEVFGHLTDDPLDHHRVTLFKHHKLALALRDPREWTHWLIAIARSDHLTKLRIRRFRVPDEAERCQGVAGQAWRCGGWVLVPKKGESLPKLAEDSDEEAIATYARATGVDVSWVRRELKRGRPLAASYAALLVRLRGEPWGVLVVDSRRVDSIDVEKLEKFKVFGSLLTPLLERV